MASVGERKAAWHHRTVIHLVLLTGAAFFLLPLLWMIATSLKPLDQTMQRPESLSTAFVATGYWVEIDGTEYDVTLDRSIDPTKDGEIHIVRPRSVAVGQEPRAGELRLPFGPDQWKSSTSFTDHELERMNKPVTRKVRVLADKNNLYDPATGKLQLRSGRVMDVELVRTIEPSDEHVMLRLVRDYLRSFVPVEGRDGRDKHISLQYSRRSLESGRALEAELVRAAEQPVEDVVLRLVRKYLKSRRALENELARAIERSDKDAVRQGVRDYLEFRPVADVELVRAMEKRIGLWLVREWRPADTDIKSVSSTFVDVERAWDIIRRDRIRTGPKFIPQNYPVALRNVHFTRSLNNTLLLCLMTVCGTVLSSVIVAYGFAFLEFPGRNALFALTLTTIMVPFVVTMVPMYLMYRSLGWVGTFKPLWVATWFGNAFFIFLLRQFFLGIPTDLLDAARIDGCSELEILWNVVVPLSRPVIAMVALFTFLGTWKDFLGPLIYLNHEKQFTLSLSLQTFQSAHGGTPWHLMMAAATVFSLPLIVLFFFAMKTFIRSVAMTGLKG